MAFCTGLLGQADHGARVLPPAHSQGQLPHQAPKEPCRQAGGQSGGGHFAARPGGSRSSGAGLASPAQTTAPVTQARVRPGRWGSGSGNSWQLPPPQVHLGMGAAMPMGDKQLEASAQQGAQT
ncbi:lectin-like [Platysternon megacephalum]|uniref:Lectin-like n=1 Tax=Platysternon megacephalum TaxID=55544 RepID=A0A4D9DYJ6_9SAUR|nr:lectin-like [Platysternon megacephalum]